MANVPENFGDWATTVTIYQANLIILGYLNVWLKDKSDSTAIQLLQLLEQAHITIEITKSTHKAGHLLDPIFTKNVDMRIGDPVELIWTDHKLTPFSITNVL